jgi:hypothetical protein
MNLKPEELVKALLYCGNGGDCDACCHPCHGEHGEFEWRCLGPLLLRAATQIEHDQKEIAALREKRRWISVTEKTPEYDMPQLALNADGDALIANYAYGEWFDTWGQDVEVTHWMPLPEPPKED